MGGSSPNSDLGGGGGVGYMFKKNLGRWFVGIWPIRVFLRFFNLIRPLLASELGGISTAAFLYAHDADDQCTLKITTLKHVMVKSYSNYKLSSKAR